MAGVISTAAREVARRHGRDRRSMKCCGGRPSIRNRTTTDGFLVTDAGMHHAIAACSTADDRQRHRRYGAALPRGICRAPRRSMSSPVFHHPVLSTQFRAYWRAGRPTPEEVAVSAAEAESSSSAAAAAARPGIAQLEQFLARGIVHRQGFASVADPLGVSRWSGPGSFRSRSLDEASRVLSACRFYDPPQGSAFQHSIRAVINPLR